MRGFFFLHPDGQRLWRQPRLSFFKICGEAATTTLGAKGPVKIKSPWPIRAGQSKEHLSLRGNEKYGKKNRGVIHFMYHSGGSPFGGWRHHLSPASGGTMGA